jgi:adenylylsulfate kinase
MVNPQGRVIWITGLSGAGKSTLARALAPKLRATGIPVVILDGDELREAMGAASSGNHGRAERLALARRYTALCKLLADQGLTVVIATISMFAEIHAANRAALPGYFEIFLKVPLNELKRRDSKGIYGRFERGELRNVAGLDLEIDEPADAHLVAAFRPDISADELADEVMQRLGEGASS